MYFIGRREYVQGYMLMRKSNTTKNNVQPKENNAPRW